MSVDKFQELKAQAEEYRLSITKMQARLEEKQNLYRQEVSNLPVKLEELGKYCKSLKTKINNNTLEIEKLLMQIEILLDDYKQSEM